jgi:hypothetical protein
MPDRAANRAAKFVSAIFASVLAGASLAGVSHDAARAADDCLAAPKDETPDGSHWHYRIDRATKRHCWYLRPEGEKLAQTAPSTSAVSAKPAASNAAPPMQRSVADAHAELPAQTSIEPANRWDRRIPAMPASPALGRDSAAGAEAPQSVIASRWPDPSAASSAAAPQLAASQMAANIQSESPSDASSKSGTSPSDPAAAPPPAAAVASLAAADTTQGLPASMPMLLGVMTGALALAGITASLVLKFGGARRTVRVRRDRIWESTAGDGVRLSARQDADAVPRRPLPRDLDQPDGPNDRVAEFYAQLSKQARS